MISPTNKLFSAPQTAVFALSADVLPLTIVMDDGSNQVVSIPKMTAEVFEDFKNLLDIYRKGIVIEPAAQDESPDQDGESDQD